MKGAGVRAAKSFFWGEQLFSAHFSRMQGGDEITSGAMLDQFDTSSELINGVRFFYFVKAREITRDTGRPFCPFPRCVEHRALWMH